MKFSMRTGTQIIAHLADETGESCPLCDDEAVIEACTHIDFKNPHRGESFTIPNFVYFTCENPECAFEFVNSRQARHNENSKVLDE